MLLDGSTHTDATWKHGGTYSTANDGGDNNGSASDSSGNGSASDSGRNGSASDSGRNNSCTASNDNTSEHEQSCERVHRALKRIVKARGALDTQEAAALREANRLRMWRAYGYASLIDYMEREMGYTPRAALERLRVAKAIEELPVLGEAMNQGDLSFSGARELSRIVTPETQDEWIAAAANKNVRQIEEMVAGHKPGDRPTDPTDPGLKTKILRYEVRLPVAAMERKAITAFEKMRGHRSERDDDSDFVEACYLALLDRCESALPSRRPVERTVGSSTAEPAIPTRDVDAAKVDAASAHGANVDAATVDVVNVDAANAGAAHVEAAEVGAAEVDAAEVGVSEVGAAEMADIINEPRYQSAVTRCTDCKRGWLHGATTVLLSPAELERALCDCVDIGSIDDDKPSRAKRSIPKAIRRAVFHRDQGRCRVPGCRAIGNVDCHHIEFLCAGGQHTVLNVLLLCEGHHLALHEGGLIIEGDALNAKFHFRPNNDFKLAARAVETLAALRKRGIPTALARSAVEATRTHVGKQDLRLDHWVELALSKLSPEAPTG